MCVCVHGDAPTLWKHSSVRSYEFYSFSTESQFQLGVLQSKHNSNQKVKSQRNSHQDLTCFHLHLCACASCPQLKQMTSVTKSNLSVQATHWQLRTILKSLRQGPAIYCQRRQFHIGSDPCTSKKKTQIGTCNQSSGSSRSLTKDLMKDRVSWIPPKFSTKLRAKRFLDKFSNQYNQNTWQSNKKHWFGLGFGESLGILVGCKQLEKEIGLLIFRC